MKKILMFIIFLSVFNLPTYAVNIDEYYKDQLEVSGAAELSDYLSNSTSEYLKELGCEDVDFENLFEISGGSIFNLISGMVKDGLKSPLKGFLTASGTVILVSICSTFFPDDEKSRIILNIISGSVIVTSVFVPSTESVKAAANAIEACCGFEKALVPVLVGVISSSGNPVTAVTYKGTAFAAAEFISAFGKNFALPLVGISGALGITGSMLPTLRLSAVSETIRKTLTVTLSSAAGLFAAFLSLKNVLSSSADGLAIKGVKLAANTFIPVIGGAIGETYTSVIASLGLLKNTVGIYAIIVFFLICIPVITDLSLRVIALRAASAVADLFDCRVCSEILKNISFVFSMINTIILLCMAVFVISTGLVISVKTGG